MERAFFTPAMRRILLIVSIVVAGGLILTMWLLLSPQNRDLVDAAAAPDPTTAPATAPTQGPLPDAAPTTGSEVLPPPPDDSGGIRLPSVAPAEPLITGPFPEAGSSEGEVIAGLPANVMGPVPGSDVLSSSIAVEDPTMQATLVARTDATPQEVEAHYAALWGGLGLVGAPRESAQAPMSYVGAHDSLTLTFSPSAGTGTVYAVYGVFQAS